MNLQENANKKEQTRFHLKGDSLMTLSKAMDMRKELQELEKPYEIEGKMYKNQWRIGKTTDSILILDIDSHDEENLSKVLANLHMLFNHENFINFKTKNGYQIYGTSVSKPDFEYKNLKVLNVDLKREYNEIQAYKKQLLEYLENFRASDIPVKHNFDTHFEKTELCKPIGKIDYLYNILGVLNGHYTIRLTRKGKNDKGWKRIE